MLHHKVSNRASTGIPNIAVQQEMARLVCGCGCVWWLVAVVMWMGFVGEKVCGKVRTVE